MNNLDRFDTLTIVLEYDSYGEKKLTSFERMYIHKERSAIIGGTAWQVPQELEAKIQAVLHTIERIKWENPFK